MYDIKTNVNSFEYVHNTKDRISSLSYIVYDGAYFSLTLSSASVVKLLISWIRDSYHGSRIWNMLNCHSNQTMYRQTNLD